MGNKPSAPSGVMPNMLSAPSQTEQPIHNETNIVEIKTKEITEIIQRIIPVINKTTTAAKETEAAIKRAELIPNEVRKGNKTLVEAYEYVDYLVKQKGITTEAARIANKESNKLNAEIQSYIKERAQMQNESKIIYDRLKEAEKEFKLAEKRIIDTTTTKNSTNKEKNKQIRLNAIKSKRISLENKNALEVKSRKKADDVGEMSYLINELDKLSTELIEKKSAAIAAAEGVAKVVEEIKDATKDVEEPEALRTYGGRRKRNQRKRTHRKRR